MADCYNLCFSTAKQFAAPGEIPSLVAGGNIAGFLKVANAAKACVPLFSRKSCAPFADQLGLVSQDWRLVVDCWLVRWHWLLGVENIHALCIRKELRSDRVGREDWSRSRSKTGGEHFSSFAASGGFAPPPTQSAS